MHPTQNMPDYGRDFTSLLSTGFLLANLNGYTNAQKRDGTYVAPAGSPPPAPAPVPLNEEDATAN